MNPKRPCRVQGNSNTLTVGEVVDGGGGEVTADINISQLTVDQPGSVWFTWERRPGVEELSVCGPGLGGLQWAEFAGCLARSSEILLVE